MPDAKFYELVPHEALLATPLPSFFTSFLHFPRSSGASIINPNVVWPWPTSLIPMRGCDARIPEGQRARGSRSWQGVKSRPPAAPRHPPSSPSIPARHQWQRTRVGSAGQEILVPGAPKVIFHEDLSLGRDTFAETPVPFRRAKNL